MSNIQHYPLFCGFSENVFGNGFVAGVRANGTVLAERSSEGWWVFGVTPGAIADSGDTLDEAVANLRRRFRAFLIDVASESSDFEAFKQEIERFFAATDEQEAADWSRAREAVRATVRAGDDTLPSLPRFEGNPKLFVHVVSLSLSPDSNTLDQSPEIAA